MRLRLVGTFAVVLILLLPSVGMGEQRDRRVLWSSRFLRVVYEPNGPLKEPGTYTFKNPTGKRVKFACVWSRTGDPYQPPFFVGWSSRLRPHQGRRYGDWGPPDLFTCGAGRVWPQLELIETSQVVNQLASDSLQVFWVTECAPLATTNCASRLWFLNRVHALVTFACTWSLGGTPGSYSDSLSPYAVRSQTMLEPDPGSTACSVTSTRGVGG